MNTPLPNRKHQLKEALTLLKTAQESLKTAAFKNPEAVPWDALRDLDNAKQLIEESAAE